MEKKLKQFKISEEVVNAILQYLAGRPYHEVFQLIPELQLPKLEELKSEDGEET